MMDNSTEILIISTTTLHKETQSRLQRHDNEESITGGQLRCYSAWCYVFSFSRELPVRCATERWVGAGWPACRSSVEAQCHLSCIPAQLVRWAPMFLFGHSPPPLCTIVLSIIIKNIWSSIIFFLINQTFLFLAKNSLYI